MMVQKIYPNSHTNGFPRNHAFSAGKNQENQSPDLNPAVNPWGGQGRKKGAHERTNDSAV